MSAVKVTSSPAAAFFCSLPRSSAAVSVSRNPGEHAPDAIAVPCAGAACHRDRRPAGADSPARSPGECSGPPSARCHRSSATAMAQSTTAMPSVAAASSSRSARSSRSASRSVSSGAMAEGDAACDGETAAMTRPSAAVGNSSLSQHRHAIRRLIWGTKRRHARLATRRRARRSRRCWATSRGRTGERACFGAAGTRRQAHQTKASNHRPSGAVIRALLLLRLECRRLSGMRRCGLRPKANAEPGPHLDRLLFFG